MHPCFPPYLNYIAILLLYYICTYITLLPNIKGVMGNYGLFYLESTTYERPYYVAFGGAWWDR